jgi:hypothetical protein
MTIKKYLESPYNLFEKGLQTSVCINSDTSVDLDSNSFRTLCLYFDRAHGLQVQLDR